MIEITPEVVMVIMVGGLILGVLTGYPLAAVLGIVSLVVGYLLRGDAILGLMYTRIWSYLTNYLLLAVPLFIFMGTVLEHSGIAERMYGALHLWLGGFRGGLAIATILIGTALAACLGIYSASVAMLSVVALPAMIKRGYNKALASGSVCAGGGLGILIPPSVMIVLYGPSAGISVGKLFMAAFIPGLVLSFLYCSYIALRCLLQPAIAPPVGKEEITIGFLTKTAQLASAALPTTLLILAVLGTIFLGIASPTEASAVGALVAVLLSIAYRRFNWQVLSKAADHTRKLCGMMFFFVVMAATFVGVFIAGGAGEVIQGIVLAMPGGRWVAFTTMMLICFILGMFIDWMGIVLLMVPIMTPIAGALGFDPVWFALMVMVNLQMSFLTPPFAPAVFILRGVAAPELGVSTSDVIRGVFPFVGLLVVAIMVFVALPQIVLWLPSMMIK